MVHLHTHRWLRLTTNFLKRRTKMPRFVAYACMEKGASLTKYEYEVGELGSDEVELDVSGQLGSA